MVERPMEWSEERRVGSGSATEGSPSFQTKAVTPCFHIYIIEHQSHTQQEYTMHVHIICPFLARLAIDSSNSAGRAYVRGEYRAPQS